MGAAEASVASQNWQIATLGCQHQKNNLKQKEAS
jgi:hypothetical protein